MTTIGSGPLSGFVFVLVGIHVFKAWLAKVLISLGATVYEIAPVNTKGDGARFVAPMCGDDDSYFFWMNNYGTRKNIALHLGTKEGREIAYALLEKADGFATNVTLPGLEKCGLLWEQLQPLFPRLVAGYNSYAGHTGPDSRKPGFHHLAISRVGIPLLTPGSDLGPIPYIDLLAAERMANLLQAGLLQRSKNGGLGVKVETSLLESAVEALAYYGGCAWSKVPSEMVYIGPQALEGHLTIETLFKAQDCHGQWFVVGGVLPQQNRGVYKTLNLEHLLEEPRYKTQNDRMQHITELRQKFFGVIRKRTADEWIPEFNANGVPAGAMQDISLVPKDPQVIARKMLVDIEGPDGVPLTVSRFAGRFGDHEPDTGRPRRYGEDTFEVLTTLLGVPKSDLPALKKSGAIDYPEGTS